MAESVKAEGGACSGVSGGRYGSGDDLWRQLRQFEKPFYPELQDIGWEDPSRPAPVAGASASTSTSTSASTSRFFRSLSEPTCPPASASASVSAAFPSSPSSPAATVDSTALAEAAPAHQASLSPEPVPTSSSSSSSSACCPPSPTVPSIAAGASYPTPAKSSTAMPTPTPIAAMPSASTATTVTTAAAIPAGKTSTAAAAAGHFARRQRVVWLAQAIAAVRDGPFADAEAAAAPYIEAAVRMRDRAVATTDEDLFVRACVTMAASSRGGGDGVGDDDVDGCLALELLPHALKAQCEYLADGAGGWSDLLRRVQAGGTTGGTSGGDECSSSSSSSSSNTGSGRASGNSKGDSSRSSRHGPLLRRLLDEDLAEAVWRVSRQQAAAAAPAPPAAAAAGAGGFAIGPCTALVEELRSALEALRPGLLLRQPATWGKLLVAALAEAQRGDLGGSGGGGGGGASNRGGDGGTCGGRSGSLGPNGDGSSIAAGAEGGTVAPCLQVLSSALVGLALLAGSRVLEEQQRDADPLACAAIHAVSLLGNQPLDPEDPDGLAAAGAQAAAGAEAAGNGSTARSPSVPRALRRLLHAVGWTAGDDSACCVSPRQLHDIMQYIDSPPLDSHAAAAAVGSGGGAAASTAAAGGTVKLQPRYTLEHLGALARAVIPDGAALAVNSAMFIKFAYVFNRSARAGTPLAQHFELLGDAAPAFMHDCAVTHVALTRCYRYLQNLDATRGSASATASAPAEAEAEKAVAAAAEEEEELVSTAEREALREFLMKKERQLASLTARAADVGDASPSPADGARQDFDGARQDFDGARQDFDGARQDFDVLCSTGREAAASVFVDLLLTCYELWEECGKGAAAKEAEREGARGRRREASGAAAAAAAAGEARGADVEKRRLRLAVEGADHIALALLLMHRLFAPRNRAFYILPFGDGVLQQAAGQPGPEAREQAPALFVWDIHCAAYKALFASLDSDSKLPKVIVSEHSKLSEHVRTLVRSLVDGRAGMARVMARGVAGLPRAVSVATGVRQAMLAQRRDLALLVFQIHGDAMREHELEAQREAARRARRQQQQGQGQAPPSRDNGAGAAAAAVAPPCSDELDDLLRLLMCALRRLSGETRKEAAAARLAAAAADGESERRRHSAEVECARGEVMAHLARMQGWIEQEGGSLRQAVVLQMALVEIEPGRPDRPVVLGARPPGKACSAGVAAKAAGKEAAKAAGQEAAKAAALAAMQGALEGAMLGCEPQVPKRGKGRGRGG